MAERTLTVFEHDKLLGEGPEVEGYQCLPEAAFEELRSRMGDEHDGDRRWLKPARGPKGRPAIQVGGYVGVLRTRDGTQIEILPKAGQQSGTVEDARAMLISMLRALPGFKWYSSRKAAVATARMPLPEIFMREFLLAVREVVRRGLRSDYIARQDNLFALRGKLLVSRNLTENRVRPDRFYTEHDEYSPERPENRLLHAALLWVLKRTRLADSQRLARELSFVFHEIPVPTDIEADFKRIRIDRGMHHYQPALDWAGLILCGRSPLTSHGKAHATALMFPMATLFEAYVAKTLAGQLSQGCRLVTSPGREFLVRHRAANWMQLKPDLLVHQRTEPAVVLDAKWKRLDQNQSGSQKKYGISQGDFYQLHVYAHYFLGGQGDLVLVYPMTEQFNRPLDVFEFCRPENGDIRLWVLPFSLPTASRPGFLVLPEGEHGMPLMEGQMLFDTQRHCEELQR